MRILGGSFRTQVFPDGDQENDVRADITFDQTVDCSALTMELAESTVSGCGSSYVLTRTWTATDDCGNASSATQTITVVDTTAPELTIPADYTAECSDAHPMDDASATDNCGEVTIDVVETTLRWSWYWLTTRLPARLQRRMIVATQHHCNPNNCHY